ncbi:MAG: YgiQ family radical SAM protein [Paludibacteraceae bacterium]
MEYRLTDFLPTTKKEMELRGWDAVDVVLFSGDAYIDHPAFGAAVIGRVLEADGLRVAIVPQPDWHGDWRDFKKFGRPRLFFAITAGAMDSMVNHYTANRRRRSNDAYSPDGRAGLRPDNCTIVYANILKELYPDVPLVIGGIEASLRRFSHYDYWTDSVHRSILVESKADLLVYGMGEKPMRAIAQKFKNGEGVTDCHNIPQIGYVTCDEPHLEHQIILNPHEAVAKSKRLSAETFRIIEEESNKLNQTHLVQPVGGNFVVINPPFAPMSTDELDAVYDLPFTRQPHPKYKGKTIPAFDMIKFSVNTHRGCWGGCAFCTISMHQGKFIVSRSQKSILKEVRKIAEMPDFKGYLSDLGGPSANMYMMRGRNADLCAKCRRPSCAFPTVCKNMNTDHAPLLALYRAVDALPCIKKSFIGSGVRYDLVLHRTDNNDINRHNRDYAHELISRHVSGRLKVAPEHTSEAVLQTMRKPSFALFKEFKRLFDTINTDERLNQQLIPYFISSHPGCGLQEMAELAIETKQLDFQLEQVQDFTPTPMTLATEMYHTGLNPYTLKPIFVARTPNDKLAQRQFFFWYKPETRAQIRTTLKKIGRIDLIDKLFGKKPNPNAQQSARTHKK